MIPKKDPDKSSEENADHHLKHYLYPSAIYAHASPSIVTTILGTCVSVCIWDFYTQKGAINHYMLPLWNGEGLASPKYGSIAIRKTIDKMKEMGSLQTNLRAKIFGGKSKSDGSSDFFLIGERNIEIAYAILEKENIPVISANVGGKYGRRIQFFTDTGDVYLNFIKG